MDKHTEPSDALSALRSQIDGLIRRRRFRRAYKLAWAELDTKEFRELTQAQFLMALTANLTNHHDRAEAAHAFAVEHCKDFTTVWDGDFHRDHLLWAIRAREFAKARYHLRMARRWHEGDNNRMACLMAAEARLLYAQRRYEEALRLHEAAEAGLTDGQWRFNNRVHWLKTLIAAGHHPCCARVQEVDQLLIDTMDQSGSRSVRLMRWSIQRWGRPANRADDLLQRTRHVVSGLR